MSRRRVTLLTTVDFWNTGAGHRARIRSLAQALQAHVELTVLLLSGPGAAAEAALAALLPAARVHVLGLPAQGSIDHARAAAAAFFAATPQHACIVEYLSLGWMRRAMPPGVLTLVDTHDVVSQRDAALAELPAALDRALLSAQQEAAQLRVFDHVIAITEDDAAVFAGWVGAQGVIVVPHPQPLRPQTLRQAVQRVLFVGSAYAPNVEALRWLLMDIWPQCGFTGDLVLDVVGDVGPAFGLPLGLLADGAVHVHGRVEDLEAAYASADLVLNPVRHGSGLKIKTVEALAHGLPLVSTRHGVRGLPIDAADPAFVVADDAVAFTQAIDKLATDLCRRQRLAAAALRLAEGRFGEEACLRPLLQVLGAAPG